MPSASSVVDGSAVVEPEREHRAMSSAFRPSVIIRGIYAGRMTFAAGQEALDFYVGLEADNSKSYCLAHKAIYDECVKAPFLELSERSSASSDRCACSGRTATSASRRTRRRTRPRRPPSTESEGGAAYYVQISSEGLYVGSGYYHLAPDQLERYPRRGRRRAQRSEARDRGRRAPQAALRRRLARVARSARRAATRRTIPRDRPAPHKGHARRPASSARRAGCTPHGALDRIVKTWRDAVPDEPLARQARRPEHARPARTRLATRRLGAPSRFAIRTLFAIVAAVSTLQRTLLGVGEPASIADARVRAHRARRRRRGSTSRATGCSAPTRCSTR